jgi:hypothetical protein
MQIINQLQAEQNGGSARGYQELVIPLADPTAANQAGGRTVCLCVANA